MEKYEKSMLEKAYVRIMLDDDTYSSGFARLMPHTPEDDIEDEVSLNKTHDSTDMRMKESPQKSRRNPEMKYMKLVWDQPFFIKIGDQKDLSTTSVYMMICFNTQSEISFIDKMLSDVSNLTFNYT